MSQKKGQETISRLKDWIAERDLLNDYADYRNGFQVSRANLIEEKVLNRSQLSVNGNAQLRGILGAAEKRWYGERAETLESHKDAREASEAKSKRISADVSRLQKALAEAQAEIAPLKAEIATLNSANNALRSELGIQKIREATLLNSYGGLTGWD
jgi:chromosome segregation ATPase